MSDTEIDFHSHSVEMLAEAWASMDGLIRQFRYERDGKRHPDAEYTGTYEGYIAEAEEMVRRLNNRGIALSPLSIMKPPSDGRVSA